MLDNGKSSGQGPWCWGCCKHYESNICQKLPPGYQSHSANHEISKQSKSNEDGMRNEAGSKGRCQERAKVPISSLFLISKSIKCRQFGEANFQISHNDNLFFTTMATSKHGFNILKTENCGCKHLESSTDEQLKGFLSNKEGFTDTRYLVLVTSSMKR